MCFFCWLGMCKWGFKVIYNILHLVFSDSNDIIIWFTTILSLKVYDDSQIPSHSNQFFFNLWNPDKFNLSDKICFRRKISGFFPQKRINLGLFKTPVTEVSLASLWWTTSRATRWWGLEAFGAPRGFPRPQKTWGGSRATIGDDDGSWESKVYIHNTHQSFIKIWSKITMWFVHHHGPCPLVLGLLRLSFGPYFNHGAFRMVMVMIEVWGPRLRATCKANGELGWDGWEQNGSSSSSLKILSFNPLFKHCFRILVQNHTSTHQKFKVVELGGYFLRVVWMSNFCWSFLFNWAMKKNLVV